MAYTLDNPQNGKEAMREKYATTPAAPTTAPATAPRATPHNYTFDESQVTGTVAKTQPKVVPHNYTFDESTLRATIDRPDVAPVATPQNVGTPTTSPTATPTAAQAGGSSSGSASRAAGSAGAAAPANAGSYSPTSYADQIAALYSKLDGYVPENVDYSKQISDLYDKAFAAQRAQLESEYDAVRRALDAAGEKIPAAYQTQGNALASEYERQRANMNERLAASGINSGAGSQAALAQNAGYLSSAAQIRQAQADAQAELERERVNREAEYQAAIRQALADNDYKRAVALTQEMKDYHNREMQLADMALGIEQSKIGAQTSAISADQQAALDRAKTLASYGDFSGYAQLYGDAAAQNMLALWQAQNPGFAYMTGSMSADDYYKLTGQYPPGYKTQRTYVSRPITSDDDTRPTREIPTGTPETPEQTVTPTTTGTQGAVSASEFNAFMHGLNSSRSATEAAATYNRLPEGYVDRLSAAQQERLRAALYNLGVR